MGIEMAWREERANGSATRPAGGVDCNHDAMAGFAAAHGRPLVSHAQ